MAGKRRVEFFCCRSAAEAALLEAGLSGRDGDGAFRRAFRLQIERGGRAADERPFSTVREPGCRKSRRQW